MCEFLSCGTPQGGLGVEHGSLHKPSKYGVSRVQLMPWRLASGLTVEDTGAPRQQLPPRHEGLLGQREPCFCSGRGSLALWEGASLNETCSLFQILQLRLRSPHALEPPATWAASPASAAPGTATTRASRWAQGLSERHGRGCGRGRGRHHSGLQARLGLAPPPSESGGQAFLKVFPIFSHTTDSRASGSS